MKAYTKDGLVWIDANGGWSVQIPDPDAMPVLGVPLGSTVEADAFVLGTARVVDISFCDRGEDEVLVAIPSGPSWRMDSWRAKNMFGHEFSAGETRRYAIVPLAEPQSEGETVQEQQRSEVAQKTIDRLKKFSAALESGKPLEECGYRVTHVRTEDVLEQLAKGEIRVDEAKRILFPAPPVQSPVPSVAESPECGTEKVWLCYAGEGFNLAKGSLPPKHREGSGPHVWNMPLESRWLEIGLEPDTARLIHPSHNLQPGECCEVPAREEPRLRNDELPPKCQSAGCHRKPTLRIEARDGMVLFTWDEDLCDALNWQQQCGMVHPYTCGNCRDDLVATPDGWVCPREDCGYTQGGTPMLMFGPRMVEMVRKIKEPLRAELTRLRSLLPTTADGVSIADCSELYCPHCGDKVLQYPACCVCENCGTDESGVWELAYSETVSKPTERAS